MGANQSRPDTDEKVFQSETPIQFSEDVVNDLVDNTASPSPSPARQASIDAQIRNRIQSELTHLRQEEEQVRLEIEQALEKENLDRERAMAGSETEEKEEGAAGSIRTSAALQGDLDELRQKVERFQTRRALTELPDVQAKGEALMSCYLANPRTTLDCSQQFEEFKSAVIEVEQRYINSLRA